MVGRRRGLTILLGGAAAVAAAVAVVRHVRGARSGRKVQGGILIRDASAYDAVSHRVLLRSFFERIAEDVATVAAPGARVLEVGCGPGRLSILLARRHGLEVTGLDLDPAMIERARANAARSQDSDARGPSFVVADVASMGFPDASFDLVLSTLSMHHWTDPAAGLAEMARVLRPGGRTLIWDLRPGIVPFHRAVPDPLKHVHGSPLRVVSAAPWRWPWRFSFTQRVELVRVEGSPSHQATQSDMRD
jgi:SAM-dependent methyltransferase